MKVQLAAVAVAAVMLSACSGSPTAPGALAGESTGVRQEAFETADQPFIGDCQISRPSDAPTEFSVKQGGSTVTIQARGRCNQTRWQIEIVRHDPTDQPFFRSHTADGRPVYLWRVTSDLVGRSFDVRMRAAWPDGAVGAWTRPETITIVAFAAPTPVAPRPPANPFHWAEHECEAAGGVYNENKCGFPVENQPWPVE